MSLDLQVQDLGFDIGGKRLLEEVTFSVPGGKLCAVVGPSGAGKSTLLKSMIGIRRPTRGRVLLGDTDSGKLARRPGLIGYVPQDDIVHRPLRVEQVLTYSAALRLAGTSEVMRKKKVDEILELLGLAEHRRTRVKRLSGGQRKRVSIAVELLTEPRVMFLDEPTSGLDPGLERRMMLTLAGLAHGGRTVVVTTHVMESMEVVDLLIVVVAGRLAFAGPPDGALTFFRVEELRQIFDALPKRDPEAWGKAFKRERGQGRGA